MPSTIEVAVFLQAEGVDGHGGARAIGRAAQHARARGVVDIEVFVLRSSVPTDEVIEQVVGEGGGGAAVGAAGDIAPTIVAAGVDLPSLVRAGRAQGMDLKDWTVYLWSTEIQCIETITSPPTPLLLSDY